MEKMRKFVCMVILAALLDLIFFGIVDYGQGGGPYGSEVTRGQDLTGKDFSGKSLIKQDFKTVLTQLNFVFFPW